MVEYTFPLDNIFGSLADPTRRDILDRLQQGGLNVGEIAEAYDMSLASVSKHLKVLEQAKLILKRKRGKYHHVTLEAAAMVQASEYLKQYERLWNERLDRLDEFLKEEN